MFNRLIKWWNGRDRSFADGQARQSQQALDFIQRQCDDYQNKNKDSFEELAKTDDARKVQSIIEELTRKGIDYRIEYLYNGNGSTKRFVVPLWNKNEKKNEDVNHQRCKYCGCLVSNFDVHCPSCGAPI